MNRRLLNPKKSLKLYRLSRDKNELELYNLREKSSFDKISALSSAEEKGREEGREEGIELTKKVFKLSNSGKSIKEIAKICEITEENVKKILS